MTNPNMNNIISAILDGDCDLAIAEAKNLRDEGLDPKEIIIHGIDPAMNALGAKCTLEQFNLLEIMLAGRAVMEVMKTVQPPDAETNAKGTVVIATLEGDVHDLGKNIVKMVLIGKGYRVVDCGKDCPLEKLLETVEKERPLAVGLSGLITPVIPLVRQVKEQLGRRGLEQIKVIAGGAALKQSSTTGLNVDFVAETAFDVLKFLESFS